MARIWGLPLTLFGGISEAFKQALVCGLEPSIKTLTIRPSALKGASLQVPKNNAVNSHGSLYPAILFFQVETSTYNCVSGLDQLSLPTPLLS